MHSAPDVVGRGLFARQDGGHRGASSSYDYEETLTAAGWTFSSGRSAQSWHSGWDWSYSGSGGYTRTLDQVSVSGSLAGTVQESGAAGEEYQYGTSSTRQADGSWQSSGSALSQQWQGNDDSYSGSGSYSHAVAGGSVNGTLTESGGHGAKSHRETVSTQPAGGSWQHESTEGAENHGSSLFSYTGSGSYSHPVGGISASGTIGGTIEESGIQESSSYYGYERKLGSAGWELTSGKQLSNWHTGTDWSYSGFRCEFSLGRRGWTEPKARRTLAQLLPMLQHLLRRVAV